MSDPSSQLPSAAEPPRVIGSLGAFAIVAGSMVGVGIFLFPGQIAAQVDSFGVLLGMMLLGGLFALSGAVPCGELGAMMPRAGGDYAFQREAFGPSIAFASGWVLYAAIFAGSNASLAFAVMQYQVGTLAGVDMTQPFLGPFSLAQIGAVGIVLFFTFINDLGAKLSSGVQTALTLTPIVALVGLSVYLLAAQPETVVSAPAEKYGAQTLTLSGLAAAFIFANFVYSGWINIIYVAAEVKEPSKNIPRSMVSATFAVTALYVLLICAFVSVLGFTGLSHLASTYTDAGTGMAQALGSRALQMGILVTIALAILTSINATVLAGGRVGYAMAKDGAFWSGAAKLAPSTGAPRRALWFNALIAVALILTGSFEAITKMTSIAMFVTGGLTVAAFFALRIKRPELPRPYKATLYPVLPGLYLLLACVAIAIQTFDIVQGKSSDGWYPLIGVAILIVTWLGHLAYRRRGRSSH